jgi:hypothetical protein
MTKAVLRARVHKYVDQADEQTLQVINAVLSGALNTHEVDSFLSDKDVEELDEHVRRLESGESKAHSWSKVKSRILKSKSKRK